jgi:hypothetical protein
MANRMLLLEFNELSPRLLARFIADGSLPNFARLYRGAEVYTTTTDDAHLEPWVQWITFHCGVRESRHGVEELDQGHTVEYPAMWDTLAGQGLSSVVLGAMNTAPARAEQVLMIPDPWSTHVAVPAEFRPYHEFVRSQVLGHTAEGAARGQLASFLRFMASHGLSRETVWGLVRQLAAERIAGQDVRWRRAACLDELQWDVFDHLWSTRKPALAVFFSNSTAFLQHRYWRHMEPDAYEVKPSAESIAAYGGAIRYGYQRMDQLVGKALALADTHTAVVLATALSQQPNLRYEKIGGKFVYRPKDFRRLRDLLGIPAEVTVEPLMTHQAWMTCRDELQAAACERALLALEMNGEPLMSATRSGNRIYFDCRLISQVPEDSLMTLGPRSMPFGHYFAFLGEVVNARHHPDGALWIHAPGRAHTVHPPKLDLADASHVLLSHLIEPQRDVAAPVGERRASQTVTV